MNDHWDVDRLIEEFVTALGVVADRVSMVKCEPSRGLVNSAVDVAIGSSNLRLLLEVKRSAYPRDVRDAVYRLRPLLRYDADPVTLPVLISDSISTAGREILRQESIGYYDSGGSLFLRASGVFVMIDKPIGKSAEKALASAFVGRRALALQAVWRNGSGAFGVKDIALRAHVSPATASETLTVLDRHDWVSSLGSGPSKVRRLVNPRAMLDAWSEYQRAAKPPAIRRYFVPGSNAAETVDRLAKACREEGCLYAITGEAAAQVHAPYLSSISQVLCRLRPGPAADMVLDQIGARPVREGWNLGVLEASSDAEFAFAESVNGVCFASPLQTYLDLLQGGKRTREMAQHLRAERLDN